MTKTERAWLAGFFDGEGCVHTGKSSSSKHYRLCIKIGQSFPGVLYYIKDLLGYGQVRSYYTKLYPAHFLDLHSKDEHIKFIKTILPYSIVKKEQLETALEFLQNVHDKPHGHRYLSKKQAKNREKLGNLIIKLKHEEPVNAKTYVSSRRSS